MFFFFKFFDHLNHIKNLKCIWHSVGNRPNENGFLPKCPNIYTSGFILDQRQKYDQITPVYPSYLFLGTTISTASAQGVD